MSTKSYKLVSTLRDLRAVLKACARQKVTALDFETTSLDPREGRVRLCQLCNNKVRVVIDFDRIKGGFNASAHLFDNGTAWIVFHAGFEQRWFDHAVNGPGRVDLSSMPRIDDVANMYRAVRGGGSLSLKLMIKLLFDVTLDKEEQASNWNAKRLTKKQMQYAWDDAEWTWKAYRMLLPQLDDTRAGRGFRMLNDMVPAVIEMEDTGMLLDTQRHTLLVKDWEKVRALRIKRVRRYIDEDDVRNINSNVQWSDYFSRYLSDDFLDSWPRTEKSGHLQITTKVLRTFAGLTHGSPMEKLLDALADYKTISKYLSSFGETLITKATLTYDGRVRARYNIGAARTDRFSSSGPNLQQMPRNHDLLGTLTSVRQSFIAPRGRRLVSLDYSGIELRVLALLSGDEQLLHDVIYGDVHTEVASFIAGRKIDRLTTRGKALRNSAKTVSFLIIYGGGALGLSTMMRCSIERAGEYIDRWSSRYPKAFALRHKVSKTARENGGYIEGVSGCRMFIGRKGPIPRAANYPVQHGAWCVMARAIVRHKDTLDALRATTRALRTTRMLSTIHDALIDETHYTQARSVLRSMRRDMTQGFLDVFPRESVKNLLEGGIGQNWGELS